MPLVFRQNGLRFHFFSNEGDPREPIHIHDEHDGREAKFWVGAEIELAYNHGLDRRDLAVALLIIRARKREIQDSWNGHFR
jgi:hypothetical protein